MDQLPSENSRSGMLLPEKDVQPYQQHIITSGNLAQGLCLPFALLWNGHFSRKESKACSRKNEMGLFLSSYGLGFTLPPCSIPHLASATWWAPGLQACSHGEEEEGAAKGPPGTVKIFCKGAWLQRRPAYRPPPRHTHTFLKNFSKLHGPTSGCWQWTLICHCKGRWERKFPLPALLFHLAHVQVQV